VGVRLDHTFDADLELRLVHPDGTAILLADNRGGVGQDYGTGADPCGGATVYTVFTDDAANPIGSGAPPFTGSFKPENSLSALYNKPRNGEWKLRVADQAEADAGVVLCWFIRTKTA
jgi:subtilisin-like proprotein convertase family protein